MRTFLFAILFGLATLCQADTLTINLTESTLSGGPGDELDFTGTLTNNTSDTVFINSDSFTFAIPGALDDSPFLNNAPFWLDPNETSTSFELFDVVIPAGTANGTYPGALTVLGGVDGNAMDNLGAVAFEVVATPEPGFLPVLAAGLAYLIYRRRRYSVRA
jgi:hypothetical protein